MKFGKVLYDVAEVETNSETDRGLIAGVLALLLRIFVDI